MTAALLGTRPLYACSLFSCTDAYSAPRPYTAIPANAPALYVQTAIPASLGRLDGGAEPVGDGIIALTTGNGDAVPFSLQDDPRNPDGRLIIPTAPFPIGTLRLLNGTCSRLNDYLFSVLPDAPAPTVTGTVSVGPSLRGMTDSPTNGPCREPIDAAVIHLQISPSAALQPYAELAQFTVTVDGKVWATEGYGRFQSWDIDEVQRADLIYARCSASANPQAPSGLTPGRHSAALSVHVAGMSNDPPPVTFEFDLDCGQPADAGVPTDGGAQDGAAAKATSDGQKTSGCRIVAGDEAAGTGPMIVLLAFFMRRRRHQGTRYPSAR
ncbi:MAG TPA: hypothetical protein VFH73_00930 [Polyangia bacterium]|jgi:hypothetical protein|nr:hypothetical protein [Polyangia bacterium]